MIVVDVERNAKPAKGSLKGSHAPLGSLPVYDKLPVEGEHLRTLNRIVGQCLSTLHRGPYPSFNLLSASRKCRVCDEIVPQRGIFAQLDVDWLRDSRVVPAAWAIDTSGDDGTYSLVLATSTRRVR